VDWSREYGRGWVPRDGVAGITVWALMVSDAMAYAGIAGVPHGVRVAAMPEAGY
jgi:MFS superfamily sulfate permease-like transporter